MAVITIRGAYRDLNAKGRGPETFRKVWRAGRWQWISSPLPRGTFLAADRHADTRGDVEVGEIIAEFGRRLPERKCTVTRFMRVVGGDVNPLVDIEFAKPRLGVYAVDKDGLVIEMTDPLARDQ